MTENFNHKCDKKENGELLPLRILEENYGYLGMDNIEAKVKAWCHLQKIPPIETKKLLHDMYLFEKEKAVEKTVYGNRAYYKLTPWGHALLGAWYKKWYYFLIYKKHNLFSFIAIILSILSLFISVYSQKIEIICN